MPIQLLIPGLLWPSASLVSPASGLALPGLERLLGLGCWRMHDFEPLERQLARRFGLPPGKDGAPLPLAALRRLGEAGGHAVDPRHRPDADAVWLCADPVNLSFAREHLLLNSFAENELDAAEAAELVAALNDTFTDLGHFEACAPTRWYLRLAAATQVKLSPLDDVVGRPVKHFLPEGEDARQWQRVMNEAQIVLHNHPLNRIREETGRRAVNSLWLWGAGALAAQPRAPLPGVQASAPLFAGLARAAGLEPAPPCLETALRGGTLVMLDALLRAAQQRDVDSWRAGLETLERDWFAPLAAALGRGGVDVLHLSAPGDHGTLELDVCARDRWKFWRKPHAFGALLKTLAPLPGPPLSGAASAPACR